MLRKARRGDITPKGEEMKTFEEIKKILTKRKKELQERFNVKEIGIFGSFVRGEQRKRSDVDILVEFTKGSKTFDNYMELKFFLEKILGLKVDIVLKSAVREELKKYIFDETIYV